jgi:hypothetical protein
VLGFPPKLKRDGGEPLYAELPENVEDTEKKKKEEAT